MDLSPSPSRSFTLLSLSFLLVADLPPVLTSRTVYRDYLRAGNGKLTLPLVIGSSALMQGAQIMSSVWLGSSSSPSSLSLAASSLLLFSVYWQSDHFKTGLAFYMGLYAMFGVLQAVSSRFPSTKLAIRPDSDIVSLSPTHSQVFTLSMGCSMGLMSYLASGRLHHNSVSRLFFAPMALFNSTPRQFFKLSPIFHLSSLTLFLYPEVGRIMSVFGRDIDTVDNQLADSLRMAAMVSPPAPLLFFSFLSKIEADHLSSLRYSGMFLAQPSSLFVLRINLIRPAGLTRVSLLLLHFQAIYFPYFLAAVSVILIGYAYFASYYRASAREASSPHRAALKTRP